MLLRSAWIPAPPVGSVPAMLSTRGTVGMATSLRQHYLNQVRRVCSQPGRIRAPRVVVDLTSRAQTCPMATPVVVFDVNETLSDLAPLTGRFADVGAPPELAATWFAAVLREGFAMSTAGDVARFATIAEWQARVLLHGRRLDRSTEDAVAHVL